MSTRNEQPLLKPALDHTSVDNMLDEPHQARGTWDRVADRAAQIYGSPWMIISQICVVMTWVSLPLFHISIDPSPFPFLNLALSIETIAAEILIMVSQNRIGQRDTALMEASRLANLRLEALQEENNQMLKIIMSYIHEELDEKDAK